MVQLNKTSLLLAGLLLTGCGMPGQQVAELNDPFLAAPVATMSTPRIVGADGLNVRSVSFNNIKSEPLSRQAARVQPARLDQSLAQPEPTPAADHEHLEIGKPSYGTAPQTAGIDKAGVLGGGVYPIDLANSLGLGGADNLQIRLARTRLFQAQARHFQAKTLWLPSIRLGVGYNKHDGRLQETEGNVLQINRNSLFYGGGLGLGAAPLAAGAGGPPRLFVNLSLADAVFKPLSACQEVAAFGAGERVATNDALLEIALAYHGLVEAHGQLANATHAQELSQQMVELVEQFERQGFSSQTEVNRATTAWRHRQQSVDEARRQTVVRGAELARLLRLPPQVQLVPVEEVVLPVDYVDPSLDVGTLVAQGMMARPEVAQYAALREAACIRVKEEKFRPWVPSVQVGASGGGFGGGPSTTFPTAASRSDLDVLAVWEWKNLGLGNVALQRQRRGELHQRGLELEAMRDQIAADVVASVADVDSYRRQVEIARMAIAAADKSYRLNAERVRDNEGLPIELLQSISALAEALNSYTATVANYNRAQYRLMRALGNPAGVLEAEVANL